MSFSVDDFSSLVKTQLAEATGDRASLFSTDWVTVDVRVVGLDTLEEYSETFCDVMSQFLSQFPLDKETFSKYMLSLVKATIERRTRDLDGFLVPMPLALVLKSVGRCEDEHLGVRFQTTFSSDETLSFDEMRRTSNSLRVARRYGFVFAEELPRRVRGNTDVLSVSAGEGATYRSPKPDLAPVDLLLASMLRLEHSGEGISRIMPIHTFGERHRLVQAVTRLAELKE